MEDVAGIEARHVVFIPPIEYRGDDYHLVK